jgi:hypothetical protein
VAADNNADLRGGRSVRAAILEKGAQRACVWQAHGESVHAEAQGAEGGN